MMWIDGTDRHPILDRCRPRDGEDPSRSNRLREIVRPDLHDAPRVRWRRPQGSPDAVARQPTRAIDGNNVTGVAVRIDRGCATDVKKDPFLKSSRAPLEMIKDSERHPRGRSAEVVGGKSGAAEVELSHFDIRNIRDVRGHAGSNRDDRA